MAKRVARMQEDAGPFQHREEFAQLLDALCTLYPHEVKLVSPGPNRKIHQLLRSATEPDRVEFYFNNLRQRWLWRSKDLTMLPSGTTSNEAIRVCKLHPIPQSYIQHNHYIVHFYHVLAMYPSIYSHIPVGYIPVYSGRIYRQVIVFQFRGVCNFSARRLFTRICAASSSRLCG